MIVSSVDIKIIRSKRKTVSIYIERDGKVTAIVPDHIEDSEISKILLTKEYQIHKGLAQWKQMNEAKVAREYVNGQSFLYLGRNYRLKLIEEKLGVIKFSNGYFLLSKSEKEKAEILFIDFYKEKLNNKIQPIVIKYKGMLDVQPNKIKVMELKNRWASCSSKGNLNFHWKCAMAPVDVLNYIVVHEMVHLLHLNHTPVFWNEVDKVMPSYEKHITWLKHYGAGMDL